MKKQTLAKIVVSSLVAAALAVTASAAFTKKNTYGGQFTDVKDTSWYAKEVASAYELGFVEGVSETSYSPDTTVTVAQGITMASRVHAEYNGKTIEKAEGKWYDMYVNYAKANGIIKDGQFDDYTREIKRFEMAEIFHDAMGEKYYNAINDVVFIPDVPMGALYYDKLLTLYNAGVVMGSDDYGSYKPNDNIKRSECAAIINRVALPENRLNKELLDFTSENAYVLSTNVGFTNMKDEYGPASGWVLDNRGGGVRTNDTAHNTLGDVSEKYATAYVRKFNFIPAGELVIEADLVATSDGTFMEYLDIEGNTTYMAKIVDGKWNVLGKDGKFAPVAAVHGDGTDFRAVINLNTGKTVTYVDGVKSAETELLSDNIIEFKIGIDEKGTGSLVVKTLNMVVNYAMYDNFEVVDLNSVYGWTVSGANVDNQQLNVTAGSAKKTFSEVSGVVTTEVMFYSKNVDDFTVSIGDVLDVKSAGTKLVAGDKELYTIAKNMWHRLRVDADTAAGTAKVWLNGRVVGTVNLKAKSPVTYFEVKTSGSVSFDEIKVYESHEYSDYVPAPAVKASLDDYITVMNICSLWKNSSDHYGWAVISPYDEPEPVIGYYDEGNAESADWEIKFMAEHGVDVQAFCWYSGDVKGPIKTPRLSDQLHDGYQYAKYSDYMYYTLLWETNSGGYNSSAFRNYVVPYLFENYFLDERYLKIDNQIVFPVYLGTNLISAKYFDGIANTKAELDYLEEVAKSYGFDGFIFLTSDTPSKALAEAGFDGSFAYNWSTKGKYFDENKYRNEERAKNKDMYAVPTASVGFDSIPWHYERKGLMTNDDLVKTLNWFTGEYIPKYSEGYDWAKNLIWLSTWNEYGEGTYMMPAGPNGFGYLDAIRETCTNYTTDHKDVVPTLKQRERINHLYPQYVKNLARSGQYWLDKTEGKTGKELENKLYINDVEVLSNVLHEAMMIPPQNIDGKVLYPFNPMTNVHYLLNAYYEWSKDAGTLKIEANSHEVLLVVGSDKYYVDGTEKDLGYTVTLFDALPMLDFEKLAKDLGYECEVKGADLYIYTDTFEEIWASKEEVKTGGWEFNGADTEGWVSSYMDLIPTGSTLKMITNSKNTGGDPIANFKPSDFPVDFYTHRYTEMQIRYRYKYTSKDGTSHLKFYYLTDVDRNWAENKSFAVYFKDNDTQGEWRTASFDLTKLEAWQGSRFLTALRFDPFNGDGEFEVDYIRFIEDPDFEYIPVEDLPMEIINGDAENSALTPFRSSNAKITRMPDADNPSNHVWDVVPNHGNVYTYFITDGNFKQGETYKISYDIKLTGCPDKPNQTSTTFCTNLRYADKGALNDRDHIIRGFRENISISDGWVHYEATYKIEKVDSDGDQEFTIYLNPQNEAGFAFQLDNIKVEVLGEEDLKQSNPEEYFDWKTAKGEVVLDTDEQFAELINFSGLTEHKVENGNLVMVADDSNDPQVYYNCEIDASEYKIVAVKFKNIGVTGNKSKGFKCYFATDTDTQLSESKALCVETKDYKDDGDGYTTAVFVFNNEYWNGNVTLLRFDPFDGQGTCYIDKIMFVKSV